MLRLSMVALFYVCRPSPLQGRRKRDRLFLPSSWPTLPRRTRTLLPASLPPTPSFGGTRATDLITTPAGIHQYFANAFKWLPRAKASILDPTSIPVPSDDAVVVSGIWQVTAEADGKPILVQLSSLAVVKRGDRWLIASFHNSLRRETLTPPVARVIDFRGARSACE
jgi:hypothetical protein